MRIVFWHSDKSRERILASAFADGVRNHADRIELRSLDPEFTVPPDIDVAVMVGVKSNALYKAHRAAGVHTVMLDKGYARRKSASGMNGWEFWRVAVNAHNPTRYLGTHNFPADRFARLGLEIAPWRESGRHILFAGSSAKYHDFYGLSNPTRYARKVFARLRDVSERPIVYRPKPSWHDARPIEGAEYSSGGSIYDVLRDAHALITHGSNACFEAVLCGVPCVILGDAVAKPISSREAEEVEAPILATERERLQWLANLAYAQFTLSEFASGEAWDVIRPRIYD